MQLRERIRIRTLGNVGGKAGEPRSSRASDSDAAADEKLSALIAPSLPLTRRYAKRTSYTLGAWSGGRLWLMVMLTAQTAYGRDLVEAATSAQSVFNKIGVAAVSIGITLGGILFAIGAANVGRMLLISGFIGACAVLGAPAIISLIGKIFGASV